MATANTTGMRGPAPGGHKVVWFCGIACFTAMVILCASMLGWVLGDRASFFEADLRVVRRPVADEANGFRSVAFRSKDVYWPQGSAVAERATKLLLGTAQDPRLAERILATNKEALRRFDECMRRTDFQLPRLRRTSAWLTASIEWRRLGRIVSLRAMQSNERGDSAAAVADVMKLVHFGHRIEGAQGNLLHWNTGSGVKRTALTCLHRLLPRLQLSPEELLKLASDLDACRADLRGLQDAYRWEYGFLNGQVDRLAAGDVNPMELGLQLDPELLRSWRSPDKFDPEHTRQLLADVIRLTIHGLNQKGANRLQRLTDRLGHMRKVTAALTKNPIGVEFCRPVLSKSILIPLQQVAREDTFLAATRTLLAVKAYQLRHGRLPDSLDKLVPDFLAAVPTDAFDGKPLRYSAAKKIVYSVGEDRLDRGGSTQAGTDLARADGNEPTFRIEF